MDFAVLIAPLAPVQFLAEYVLQRPAISVREVRARFAQYPAAELEGLVVLFARLGLLRSYRPVL